MSRSILFDTETTGLDPLTGDRMIEFCGLELVRGLPTGEYRHWLIDPEREIDPEATRVHGLTWADLRGKPLFPHLADELLAFIGDDPLVAHNAPFDFGFLNAELARIKRPAIGLHRMVDTLDLARTRFPGLPNSLDALCRRFGIDLAERTSHNAHLDCRLLAEVYIELTGGRQRGLSLVDEDGPSQPTITYAAVSGRVPRPMVPTPAELAAHAAFLERLKQPIWIG